MKPDDPGEAGHPSCEEIANAMGVLKEGGCCIRFEAYMESPFLSVDEVAVCLSVGPKWVREHLDEFPNRFTIDGRSIRIPQSDLVDAVDRWRIDKTTRRA